MRTSNLIIREGMYQKIDCVVQRLDYEYVMKCLYVQYSVDRSFSLTLSIVDAYTHFRII